MDQIFSIGDRKSLTFNEKQILYTREAIESIKDSIDYIMDRAATYPESVLKVCANCVYLMNLIDQTEPKIRLSDVDEQSLLIQLKKVKHILNQLQNNQIVPQILQTFIAIDDDQRIRKFFRYLTPDQSEILPEIEQLLLDCGAEVIQLLLYGIKVDSIVNKDTFLSQINDNDLKSFIIFEQLGGTINQ